MPAPEKLLEDLTGYVNDLKEQIKVLREEVAKKTELYEQTLALVKEAQEELKNAQARQQAAEQVLEARRKEESTSGGRSNSGGESLEQSGPVLTLTPAA